MDFSPESIDVKSRAKTNSLSVIGGDHRDQFTRENLRIQRYIDKKIGAAIEEASNLLDEFQWTAKFEDLTAETVSTGVLHPNRGP